VAVSCREQGEEVGRRLGVVGAAIGAQPGPVVPAALVDAEALGLGRGALVSRGGETAVNLSAAGSNACEDVHLAGA
jgi:hypothetical protein